LPSTASPHAIPKTNAINADPLGWVFGKRRKSGSKLEWKRLWFKGIPSGTQRATVKRGTWEKTNVTLRIEKDSDGQTTTLRLIGRMRREHIEELKAQIKAGGTNVTLDLNEVSLVDLDVIRFLATCQTEGISIVHCSRYINNWIAKERFRGQ
jgi:hypothetical protein